MEGVPLSKRQARTWESFRIKLRDGMENQSVCDDFTAFERNAICCAVQVFGSRFYFTTFTELIHGDTASSWSEDDVRMIKMLGEKKNGKASKASKAAAKSDLDVETSSRTTIHVNLWGEDCEEADVTQLCSVYVSDCAN